KLRLANWFAHWLLYAMQKKLRNRSCLYQAFAYV
ncbi:hypothetical protein SEEMEL47_06560, partial [Salmonella enterica subsp. enterica serovar Meleagridis]